MIESIKPWADPWLVYPVAIVAVFFLVVTVWLFRRRERTGRQAGMICLVISVILHAVLIMLVPLLPSLGGSGGDAQQDEDAGVQDIAVAVFVPEADLEDTSMPSETDQVAPLPVGDLFELAEDSPTLEDLSSIEQDTRPMPEQEIQEISDPVTEDSDENVAVPSALAAILDSPTPESDEPLSEPLQQSLANLQEGLDDWLNNDGEEPSASETDSNDSESPPSSPSPVASGPPQGHDDVPPQSSQEQYNAADQTVASQTTSGTMNVQPTGDQTRSPAPRSRTNGNTNRDFANRIGVAKQEALARTGGDEQTEAAVAKALRFLASRQRADGGFDMRQAGAGQERRPLGESRADRMGVVAGTRSEMASTGLALLAMMGAGNTHRRGEYSDAVYQGLVHLLENQKRDGSLAGNATLYASNYSHGMAALAMAEAAAITGDRSAVEGTRRALSFTHSIQHPVTGGFRYTPGDPGDLSQLGWQVMVLDGGERAGLTQVRPMIQLSKRFLRSVRSGRTGGLASYRPNERPTRTMTAEALATRLLLGESVPKEEIFEAEQSLLQQPPGTGQDNYYYWYYATLALHQLQDAAWKRWNAALKTRLLSTQRADGSWPTDSVWGGYGGSIYTTSMATLCLETYYRHELRQNTPAQTAGQNWPATRR